jgi:polyisoprenoid-binding protein YceI
MTGTSPSTDRSVLPVAGTYAIDPSHSTLGFSVRHLGISKVRGRFAAVEGTITVAENPAASSAVASIPAASVDTRDAGRDEHLRSADFFDVEHHPTIDFRSTGVRQEGSDWKVDGELTIRGTTRPVTLDVEYEGTAIDPWGNTKVGFSATTEIDREEFGLTWNQALETGGVLVGRRITVELEVQAVRS